MNIAKDCLVALSYELKVEDHVADSANAENPLEFIFGHGQLLPLFEDNIKGLSVDDTFEFLIPCKDGYGEYDEMSIIELSKDLFVVDGVMRNDLLVVGNRVPMRGNDGALLYGVIKEITETKVLMDFNHPMAGKDLHFTGKVVGVRQATEEELCGGGCDSGCCGDCHCH